MSNVKSKAMTLFEKAYPLFHGDDYLVLCVDPIEGFLTKGHAYIVKDIIDSDPSRILIEVTDDRGLTGHFKMTRFCAL